MNSLSRPWTSRSIPYSGPLLESPSSSPVSPKCVKPGTDARSRALSRTPERARRALDQAAGGCHLRSRRKARSTPVAFAPTELAHAGRGVSTAGVTTRFLNRDGHFRPDSRSCGHDDDETGDLAAQIPTQEPIRIPGQRMTGRRQAKLLAFCIACQGRPDLCTCPRTGQMHPDFGP